MRLTSLHFMGVEIPLRRSFTHARATREKTLNCLVIARLDDGVEGLGEGVPREYVTGETPQTTRYALTTADFSRLAGDFTSFADVVDALRGWDIPTDADHVNHAARCAVEIAVLDAFGRCFDVPIGRAASLILDRRLLHEKPQPVRYSIVIPLAGARKRVWLARLARLAGFGAVKVKVGKDVDDDVAAVESMRRALGPRVDLRIDANGAWSIDQAREALDRMK